MDVFILEIIFHILIELDVIEPNLKQETEKFDVTSKQINFLGCMVAHRYVFCFRILSFASKVNEQSFLLVDDVYKVKAVFKFLGLRFLSYLIMI